MADAYGGRQPNVPFATFIQIVTNYLDPENYDIESLKRLAKRESDPRMQTFKSEFREVLIDPSRLPGDELFDAVEYPDQTDEAFLSRLWRELYGDEVP